MSDISISADTMQSMAYENLLAGPESVKDSTSEILSGANQNGMDATEQTVAGAQVASKTTEFFGASADLSSTGTDIDIQHAVSASLANGMGSIADKVV